MNRARWLWTLTTKAYITLAEEFDARLIPTNAAFDKAVAARPGALWTTRDGVHPECGRSYLDGIGIPETGGMVNFWYRYRCRHFSPDGSTFRLMPACGVRYAQWQTAVPSARLLQ